MSGAVVLRSALFNLAFYLNFIVWLLAAVPTLVMPRHAIIAVVKAWGRVNLWLLRVICGIDVEWRGLEKIPPGPLLVAAKHQSAWETFALLPLFSDPTFILKRELMWLPLFGWLAHKAGMIPVDRSAGKDALGAMTGAFRAALAEGRQVIIFPEGTRRPPEAEPSYKLGILFLYAGRAGAVSADRAQFRTVLGAARVSAPPRDNPGRNPRSHSARAGPARFLQATAGGHRDGHRGADRARPPRTRRGRAAHSRRGRESVRRSRALSAAVPIMRR